MKKTVLLNPGPVNVTAKVRKALAGPDICHREPEFRRLLAGVRAKLLGIFGLEKSHGLALFTGSGTCALEAMVASFAGAGKKTLVLSNGVYGERIRSILEFHRLPYRVLSAPPGDFPSLEAVDRALADPGIGAVALVHHETSTGMLNPLREVVRLAKKRKKYVMTDAISSLGAEPADFSGVDLVAGVSGKCLHAFPGVSFVLVSKRAAAELKKRPRRTLYLDLASALDHVERGDTAFTPAVQVLYAFDAALDELRTEGLARREAAYLEKSRLLAEGMRRLGVRPVVEDGKGSRVLAAFWIPEGTDYGTLHARMRRAGFVIYSGQSQFKDRIFRVSNLGDVSKADLRRFLSELGRILGRGRRG